jgi:hypothetical protein
MSEARSWAREYAKDFVYVYDADDYSIRCGRTGRFKALCRVRIYGFDSGSYNCSVYVRVYVGGNKIRGRYLSGNCGT